MKNKLSTLIFTLSLSAIFSTGCAKTNFNLPEFNLASIAGINISDLEKAKESGIEKVFQRPYEIVFDEIQKIVKSKSLHIYQSNKRKKYIIAMGVPKQVNTTRIGIFFESLPDNKTKVTLSSLSTSALLKAKELIFGG
ncbi:MAG: hypothetical protein ABH869_06640 [Candidatus Omnitrophota bacterium]